MPTAVITGASRGLGFALSRALAERGWRLVLDARGSEALTRAADGLRGAGAAEVRAIPGDVADPVHRASLGVAAGHRVDLLVNNASLLGPSPLPSVGDLGEDALTDILAANVVGAHGLLRVLLPGLRAAGGVVVDVTSDAAVEAYPGWGGYGASKAALDRLAAVLAEEEHDLAVYAFDPGDMRTQMHQDAYPGEDISDRPDAESVVPALLRLVAERPPSGRYRAADLVPPRESDTSAGIADPVAVATSGASR